MVKEIEALSTQEDLHTARLREAVRKRQEAERLGVEAHGRLAASLQGHYGKRSTTLLEFGLKPLSGPDRRREEDEPEPEPEPGPEAPVPEASSEG